MFNGSFESLFASGVTLSDRTGTVEALETAYKTPSSYNWSIGLRREIGWGTMVDATYTGYLARNMEMHYDLAVPTARAT